MFTRDRLDQKCTLGVLPGLELLNIYFLASAVLEIVYGVFCGRTYSPLNSLFLKDAMLPIYSSSIAISDLNIQMSASL